MEGCVEHIYIVVKYGVAETSLTGIMRWVGLYVPSLHVPQVYQMIQGVSVVYCFAKWSKFGIPVAFY